MAIQVTYPGVYIEEIPSGLHTIVGVATSITAFIGRAVSGDTTEPISVFNFGDYQRFFGGLDPDYPMSYAVRDFFMNGGSQAYIVRLVDTAAQVATADAGGGLKLEAASAGIWGNSIPLPSTPVSGSGPASSAPNAAAVPPASAGSSTPATGTTSAASTPSAPAPTSPSSPPNGLSVKFDAVDLTKLSKGAPAAGTQQAFNLTVSFQPPNGSPAFEKFLNVVVSGPKSANRIDSVLAGSSYVQMLDSSKVPPPPFPAVTAAQVTTGQWIVFSNGADSGHLIDPATKAENLSAYTGDQDSRTGIFQLEKVDLFNILCVPPDTRNGEMDSSVLAAAAQYCQTRRAMLIVDPPLAWSQKFETGKISDIAPTDLGIFGDVARNVAVYFPRVIEEDPMMKGQEDTFVPSGIVAGIYASTDVTRGVWKAPAGQEAGLQGIVRLEEKLTDPHNGILNPLGINCLREFPVIGPVVWGARTLRGADQFEDDYKYVPVRRLTLFIEESLYRGTQWAVFEPNDEQLWAQMRLTVGTFMADLNRQGAFYAYVVTCDATTTTQSDIDKGIVNILVQFAPVKPAEFVVLQIQQIAGQSAPA